MIKDRSLHYMSAGEIKAFQEEQLRETLNYVSERSAFYRNRFAANNIDVDQIRTLEDLQKLPVTTKQDLQLHGDEFVCVDRTEIIDYVTTSGTLGNPVTFALTEADLQRLSYNEASSFTMAGLKKGDIMQLMTTIDRRFMAGLAYFMGALLKGLQFVREAARNTLKQQ